MEADFCIYLLLQPVPGSSAVGVPRRCPTCAGLSRCPSLAGRSGTQNCYFTRRVCWGAFPRLNSNDREGVCGRQGLSPPPRLELWLSSIFPNQHPQVSTPLTSSFYK